MCISKLGNQFLYSSSCYTLWSHIRTFPHPLTPSLHYKPNSFLLKILWQRESQIPSPDPWNSRSWPPCHPCIVEVWWQGFRFHTITTHTQTDTFSPSSHIPHSPMCCLCLGLWSRSRGSACLGKHSALKSVMWERPTCFGGWTIFLPRVFSTQLSLPPAATLESWESEIISLHFQPCRRLMERGRKSGSEVRM